MCFYRFGFLAGFYVSLSVGSSYFLNPRDTVARQMSDLYLPVYTIPYSGSIFNVQLHSYLAFSIADALTPPP